MGSKDRQHTAELPPGNADVVGPEPHRGGGSGGAGDKEEIDFHRWVLFLNHRFSDRIKLFSELELEHSLAGDGKPGEVELGLDALVDKYGLEKVVDALARKAREDWETELT